MRTRIHWLNKNWQAHRETLTPRIPFFAKGGGFHNDLEYHQSTTTSKERISLLVHGKNQIEMLMSHSTMSYEAMPNLLIRPNLPWPFLAMSRICFEASSRICYVLEKDITPDKRLMRIAALVAWNNVESRKAAIQTLETSSKDLKEAIEALDTEANMLDSDMAAIGFTVDRQPKWPVIRDPSGTNSSESSDLNLIDTLGKQFTSMGSAHYRRASGFIHGAPWALGQTLNGSSSETFRMPKLSKVDVADTFLLVGVSVNNAINLSAIYSGIPFGMIQWQLRNIQALTLKQTRKRERLNLPSFIRKDQ